MRTAKQWAPIIIAYMQKNPTKTIEELAAHIEAIVEMVQEDCGVTLNLPENDNEPSGAA